MGERTWKALPLLGMSRLFGSHLLQRQNIKQSFDGRGARTSSRFSRSLQPTAAATYSFGGSQAPVFSFSSAQYAVNESTSLVVLTVLKLTPGSATVSFSLQSGSAVPYDSQTQTGDYLTASPLTFTSSDTNQAISIFIYNDTLRERDETFTVT